MKVLSLASILSMQSPKLKERFIDSLMLVLSPLDDDLNAKFIKCEIGAISWALALICKTLKVATEFEDLDEGELSGESNLGEEEAELIAQFIKECDYIIVSEENFAINKSQMLFMLNRLASVNNAKIIGLDGDEVATELGEFDGELEALQNFDGAVVFTGLKANSVATLHKALLTGGEYFKMAAKIGDGAELVLDIDGDAVPAKFQLNRGVKGTVALLSGDADGYKFVPFKIINKG